MTDDRLPAYFHPAERDFRPAPEWTGTELVPHPERVERAASIHHALEACDRVALIEAEPASEADVLRIHDADLLTVYRTASALAAGQGVHPTCFPRGAAAAPGHSRADPSKPLHAGNWCFDTGTPLDRTTLSAALGSAGCALAAAAAVREGEPLAYALCRPPGHHATRGSYGGYCYVNNAALAARMLRPRRRVAVLDIDVHHGNGTQSLFWRDPRVLFVSIHEHPDRCFPYFAGHPSEVGEGRGRGTTLNVTEEAGCDGARYVQLLESQVIPVLRAFRPDVLVLSAGFDTYALDPIGRFALQTHDYLDVGRRIGRLGLPTVVVQEGGYHVEHLGRNALALLDGLRVGA